MPEIVHLPAPPLVELVPRDTEPLSLGSVRVPPCCAGPSTCAARPAVVAVADRPSGRPASGLAESPARWSA